MNKLTLGFLGTPYYAAELLSKLAADKRISMNFVYTQPDQPVGRKQTMTESPVKKVAKEHDIKVYEGAIDGNLARSVDLILVYAYGKIIPANLLQLPKYGFLNLHFSLLPKLRGPSPTAYSLIMGEKKTGVSLFLLAEKVDEGPIVKQADFNIPDDMKRLELDRRLSELSNALFLQFVDQILTQNLPSPLPFRPQLGGGATYTRLLGKKDGFIPYPVLEKVVQGEDFPPATIPNIFTEYANKNGLTPRRWDNRVLYDLYRGLYPWPGIWTTLPDGKRLKITGMKMENGELTLTKVQLEGKNEVDYATFRRAYNFL